MSSIPPQAKRIFKGVIFEVWQWEQEMYDGSKEIFEMLKRPNTVVVIATVGDKILLQEQEQPHKARVFTSLPGGRVNEGEEPLAAAKRELMEETGYESDEWELWRSVEPYGKMDWTIFTFIARDCRQTQEADLDAGERITAKLITFEDFLLLSEDQRFVEHDLARLLLRARYEKEKRDELHKMIFKIFF